MAVEVGAAYVSIIPSFKGFGRELSKQIGEQTRGVGLAAGERIGRDISAGALKAGKSTKALGRAVSVNVGAPIAAVGALSFKAFGDFDLTMRQIGVQTGQTGKALEGMTDLALKMGKETSFGAGDAADAMLALAKGGMSAAQIEGGALSQTLTLAAAGGLELSAAAAYMSNTLSVFGLKAADSAKVAAALAGGANASTATVESLGLALSQVGPGAKLAGMTVNETVGALAAFDQAGIKGSDAGTSLKTMLLRLVPSTKVAADEMKRLGLDFTDAQGNILPLADVAQQLQDRMSSLSAEEKTAALNTIFGADAYRAAAVLASNGAAGLDKYTLATQDLGAAQALAKTNTEGAKGSIEQMTGSIETAQIAFGKALAPSVTAAAKKVTGLANAFTALPPGMQQGIVMAGGLATALGPVTFALGQTVVGVTKTAQGIGKAATSVAGLATGIAQPASGMTEMASKSQKLGSAISRGASASVGGLATVFGKLGKPIGVATKAMGLFTLSLLANPIGIIVVAIIALVTAGVLLYKNWKPFRKLVDTVWAALVKFAKVVGGIVVKAFGWLVEKAKEAWAVLRVGWAVFKQMLAIATRVFKAIFEVVGQPLKGIIQVVKGFVQIVVGIFTGDLGKITSGIANIFGGVLRFFLGMPARIIAALITLAPKLLAFGKKIGTVLLVALIDGTLALLTFFKELPGKVWRLAVALVATMARLGRDAVVALADRIARNAVKVWDFFTALPGKVLDLIKSLPEKLLVFSILLMTKVRSGLVTGFVKVREFFTKLPGRVLALLGGFKAKLRELAESMMLGLVAGIQGAAGAVSDAVIDVVHKGIQAGMDALQLGSPSKVFMAMGATAGQSLADGIAAKARAVARASAGTVNAGIVAARGELAGAGTLRASVSALPGPGSLGTGGVPDVHVYIGDKELRDIMRIEMRDRDGRLATALASGRTGWS